MSTNPEATVTLEFELELQTDPLGATLSVAVPDAVNEAARQAFLDSAEGALVGARGNLVSQAVQEAHDQLASYGGNNDYHVNSIEASFQGVDVDRGQTALTIEWAWTHEAASFMEFGTPPHTVQGDPLLVFEFSEAEHPGLAEMFPDGTAFLPEVDVSGLPEARWVRDSLHWLRREVAQT
jgi:hypothetical protein